MTSEDDVGKIYSSRTATAPDSRVIAAIRQAVGGIQFGSVEIVIHEGRVVQIERRERVRWGGAMASLSGQGASADRIHSGG